MREIKFRIWNKSHKKMNHFNSPSLKIDHDSGLHFKVKEEHIYLGGYADDIMQYTGMNDCNNVEIYDGDICVDSKGDIVRIVQTNKYQWGCKIIKGGTLAQGLIFPLWQWDNYKENGYRTLKIIGNIYENPEFTENNNGV